MLPEYSTRLLCGKAAAECLFLVVMNNLYLHPSCCLLLLLVCCQVSSIGLYLSGLIGFAVLLALVEQSVLQVYETRVELGSPVLETGHILVLCWCK